MPTSYEKLYENVLPKFKSYEIPLMTVYEVKEHLGEYIIPAIGRFTDCRKNLYDRDGEAEQFNDDLGEQEINILGNYLVIEYIDSTCIRTPALLKAHLPSADFHAFSPANHLDKLLLMHDKFLSENDVLLSRYLWKDDSFLSDMKKFNPKKRGVSY